MRATRTFHAIEVHAEGEQGTCYLGSVFPIPGVTMREKLRYINETDDTIIATSPPSRGVAHRRAPTSSTPPRSMVPTLAS